MLVTFLAAVIYAALAGYGLLPKPWFAIVLDAIALVVSVGAMV